MQGTSLASSSSSSTKAVSPASSISAAASKPTLQGETNPELRSGKGKAKETPGEREERKSCERLTLNAARLCASLAQITTLLEDKKTGQ